MGVPGGTFYFFQHQIYLFLGGGVTGPDVFMDLSVIFDVKVFSCIYITAYPCTLNGLGSG